MIPLGLLSPGEAGEIAEIRIPSFQRRCRCRKGGGGGYNYDCQCGLPAQSAKEGVRLEDMGLRVGKNVEMLTNCGGPVLLKVDESRIAIARGMAMKILVRRIQQ
ncbi:MAG TPA: FeoA family protein [Geobacteraceae bacterium]|nr:FeoA family protein [Geobacteraceae bacterium]